MQIGADILAPGLVVRQSWLQRWALPLLFAYGKNLPRKGSALDPAGIQTPAPRARIRSLYQRCAMLFFFSFFPFLPVFPASRIF